LYYTLYTVFFKRYTVRIMILIRNTNYLNYVLFKKANLEIGAVATIGNFDGLHRGHQAIFQQLKAKAAALGLPSVVITFEPLPREYFLKKTPENMPSRLTRFKEKYKFLENQGIDILMCLPFNTKFAQLTATQFIENILLNTLKTKHLIIGEDFRFGYKREGGLAFLQTYVDKKHFTMDIAPVLMHDNQRISSTRIREALQKNYLNLAKELLGRQYSLLGKVIHGDKRAREWGIPTANLSVHRSILPTVMPIKGVYAVSVSGLESLGLTQKTFYGVANVGRRPTVNGFRHLLEVHLLNFNQDIYGKTIEVKFIKKLRDEKRFESLDLLKAQIERDVQEAKTFFTT
jgi:riboflavin kinase/FMN adenylyltransferase